MIRNYLKTALRSLIRNRIISFINIIGLAIGLASCILIFLYVSTELNYENQHDKRDRIYRVTTEFNVQGQVEKYALSSFQVGPTLLKDYPEIEQAVRLLPAGKQTLWYQEQMFNIEKLYFSDSTFFDIFSFDFKYGNPTSALKEPKSIVLSHEMSIKLFGETNPLGKMVQFSKNTYTITGVLAHNPYNTHMEVDALISLNTIDPNLLKPLKQDWFRMSIYTYLLFQNPSDAQGFDKKLAEMYDNYIQPWTEQNNLTTSLKFETQALNDIHLRSEVLYDLSPNGNLTYIYIFSLVTLFILLIACINYMNIATARASKRAKEVGMRKVVGATKGQLVRQFIGESVIIAFLALLFSFVMVELLLPVFNNLTGYEYKLRFSDNLGFIGILALLLFFVGLAGGAYPAFILSSFKPVEALKSRPGQRGGNALLRKSLVVLQFTISIGMAISTIVVYSQMHYMKNKDLGFDKNQVMVIDIPVGDTTLVNKLEEIKHELKQNPKVSKVSTSANIPGQGLGKLLFFVDIDGKTIEKTMNMMFVDYDFIDLMDIHIQDGGRGFSKDQKTDLQEAFIINEAAADYLGWETGPLGQKMRNGLGFDGKVIGVMDNFHFKSLHNPIDPLVLMLTPKTQGFLLAKLSSDDMQASINFVEETWKKFDTRHPLEYFFLDENFDQLYSKEEKMLSIFGYFSALTIIIACLGLFGLASFMAEQRTKEIGIRKVMGTTVSDIIILLSKDFAKLVLLSFLLATPIAYYFMEEWLQDFAFRTQLAWWIFAIAGVAALVIAILTVSFQAVKAALANPVNSLRYE